MDASYLSGVMRGAQLRYRLQAQMTINSAEHQMVPGFAERDLHCETWSDVIRL
jgi:hypothetical protein